MTTQTDKAQDFLMGGGAVGCQFPKVGHSYTGTVLSWSMQQVRNYETKELDTYADGNPIMKLVIVLATSARGKYVREDNSSPWQLEDIADDDGVRALHCKPAAKAAIKNAVLKAKAKGLEKGALLTITRTKNGPKPDPSKNPVQGFSAEWVPAAQNPAAAALLAEDEEDPFADD